MRGTVKLTTFVLLVVLCIVVQPVISDMPIWDPNAHNYPRTIWSDYGRKGTVTGRVSASVEGTIGAPAAYIAIVNGSNASQEYYNTTSDAYGNYIITGVNATYSSRNWTGPDGGSGTYARGRSMYKIYANKTPYGEGYSEAFGIDSDLYGSTTTSVVLFPKEAFIPAHGPLTVWSERGRSGAATGRVTTSVNGTGGLSGAYIAIVNGSNERQEYFNTTSDAHGNYVITGLNATYDSILLQGPDGTPGTYNAGRSMYKIYANKTPYGEGYSEAFGIDASYNSTTTTSVIIFTKPARIELKAERPYVMTDGSDNIKVTATMYDALGNTVSDGYLINFTVGNATNNSFLGYGDFRYPVSYKPYENGSLDTSGNNANFYQDYTRDNTGSVGVRFGWVNESFAGNNSTIWAYYNDDSSVKASIKINFNRNAAPGIIGVSVNRTSISLYDDIKVSYTLNNADPNGNDVCLQITDHDGVMVKYLDTGIQFDGRHDIVWNGRYDNGTHVPDGNYIFKIAVHTSKIVPGQLAPPIKQYEYAFEPFGVAVDSTGNVIVADWQNKAVKRIYPDGTMQSVGSGIKGPSSVAVGSMDKIYVADARDNTTKIVYPNGTTRTIGSGFNNPLGIAVDSKNNVYVSDFGNNATKKIYPNGTIVILDSGNSQPYMIAVDKSDNVYVTYPMDGIVKEIYTNNTVRVLPKLSNMPVGVAVDSYDNIYVTDFANYSIKVLYTNNTIRTLNIGVYFPLNLAFDPQDNMYVIDMYNHSVVEIYTDGSTRTFKSNINNPLAAIHDVNDDIYVTESYGYGDVKVIHSNGTTEVVGSGLDYPCSIDKDASGNIYVADTAHDLIKVIYANHTIGTLGSGFKFPVGIAVDGNGNVYVADTSNNAIKMIYPNNPTVTLKENFHIPTYIDVDNSGNVYIVNNYDRYFKELYPNGTVRILGNGYKVRYTVKGIAVDDGGNVYITDLYNNTIAAILPDGNVINLSSEYIHDPSSLSIDAHGNICIVDSNAISVFPSPSVITSDPIGISVTGIPVSFTYHLNKGWNLVSVPLNLSNSSFDSFFPADVKSHVVVVWAYEGAAGGWKYYTPQPGYDPNTLTMADAKHGYWVKVDQEITFTICGTAGDGATLHQGWNLVGYPSLTVGDLNETYPSAFVVWQYKNGQWYYYTPQPGYDPNTLTGMDPGYGYWVKVI